MAPPEKRLIFFSTNHVSKMPLEIKQLADQQGARTEFPNFDLPMTVGLFDLFFPVTGHHLACLFWDRVPGRVFGMCGRDEEHGEACGDELAWYWEWHAGGPVSARE